MTHFHADRSEVYPGHSGGALERLVRRRGFTLVELLVVIGIIVVLIAIVAAGIRHTSYLAARHETAAELKVCQDLLIEYQAVNGMKNLEGPASSGPATVMNLPSVWTNHGYTLPMFLDPMNVPEVTGKQPGTAYGFADFKGAANPPQQGGGLRSIDIGDMTDKSSGNNPRYTARASYNTTGVMYILLKDPRNRALVSAMPPKRILETWAGFNPNDKAQKAWSIDAAVLLDAWENPIIYVPRGGMHVWLNPNGSGKQEDFAEYVVRTSGTYKARGASIPPVTKNDRPFFASCGPDGYFADLNTDETKRLDRSMDNMYSFQEP